MFIIRFHDFIYPNCSQPSLRCDLAFLDHLSNCIFDPSLPSKSSTGRISENGPLFDVLYAIIGGIDLGSSFQLREALMVDIQ